VEGEPERLALYEGGLQVDFVFNPHTTLAAAAQMLASGELPDTVHRGVRVLIDKDHLLPAPPAPGQPPAAPPPTQAEFNQALEAFWFGAVYCAKQLRRGELWMFQNGSGGMLWNLLRMVEWTSRAAHGWQLDTWHAGKFIAEWADPRAYAALSKVFAHFDESDGWQALQARLDLFHRLARELAGERGFPYPAALEDQIIACVRRLQGSTG
jgi:aminoglycoside 6-adenylyltransferase